MADIKKEEPEKKQEIVYRVTKPWGSHLIGEILKNSREVRRKLDEGGCLEETTMEKVKEERKEESDAIIKMQKESKNKMQKEPAKNKGA